MQTCQGRALKYQLHHLLEGGRRTGQAHWHCTPLTQALAHLKSGLFPILFSHFHLPVAIREVQRGLNSVHFDLCAGNKIANAFFPGPHRRHKPNTRRATTGHRPMMVTNYDSVRPLRARVDRVGRGPGARAGRWYKKSPPSPPSPLIGDMRHIHTRKANHQHVCPCRCQANGQVM